MKLQDLICVRGQRPIFGPLSYDFSPGSLYLISGPNGSGKTSLLYIIAGVLEPYQGTVSLDSTTMVFIDNRLALKPNLSVVENLRFLHGDCSAETLNKALGHWHLIPHRDTPVHQLSAGWQQRVALCRLSLSSEIPLWLLDEPFVHLDKKAQVQLVDIIKHYVEKGGIIILTSHDYPDTLPISSIIRMENYQSTMPIRENDLW